MLEGADWNYIPHELKQKHQWCVANKNKVPQYLTANGALVNASPVEGPWMAFEQACSVAGERNLNIGYMLTADDGFTCIDMDVKDVVNIDAHGRRLEPHLLTSREQLQEYKSLIEMAKSYAELSASGSGLHLWVKGNIGAGRRGGGIEVYSQERFIICTGRPVSDISFRVFNGVVTAIVGGSIIQPVEERQHLLDIIVNAFKSEGVAAEALVEVEQVLTDDEIWKKAREAENAFKFKALCAGEYSQFGFPSQSEADLALMSMFTFYSKSNEQCRRLFRQTALGVRGKAANNDKYLNRTLGGIRARQAQEERVMARIDMQAVMESGLEKTANKQEVIKQLTQKTEEAGAFDNLTTTAPHHPWNTKTLISVDTSEPEYIDLEYLDNPYIPKGYAIGLYGRGGSGKSSFASTIAANNSDRYSTLWITSEESSDNIRIRHRECGGQPNTIGVISQNEFNVHEHLEHSILQAQGKLSNPLGFVVLDAITALVTWRRGESANDDGGVKRLIAFINRIALKEGVSILMIGHLNKGKDHNHIADAVTGSAAWTTSTRLSYMFTSLPDVEFGGVLQTCKESLVMRFGSFYTTTPVYKFKANVDGIHPSLCKLEFKGKRLYGKELSEALSNAMAGGRKNEKQIKVGEIITTALELLADGEQKTRTEIAKAYGGTISPRHWQEVDNGLGISHVEITKGSKNSRIYKLKK